MEVMSEGYNISVYEVLEKLIKYLERENLDIKLIKKLKECKDLAFMEGKI